MCFWTETFSSRVTLNSRRHTPSLGCRIRKLHPPQPHRTVYSNSAQFWMHTRSLLMTPHPAGPQPQSRPRPTPLSTRTYASASADSHPRGLQLPLTEEQITTMRKKFNTKSYTKRQSIAWLCGRHGAKTDKGIQSCTILPLSCISTADFKHWFVINFTVCITTVHMQDQYYITQHLLWLVFFCKILWCYTRTIYVFLLKS